MNPLSKIPTSTLIKFGKNGVALVIPPEYMKERNLKVGDIVSYEIFKIIDKNNKEYFM